MTTGDLASVRELLEAWRREAFDDVADDGERLRKYERFFSEALAPFLEGHVKTRKSAHF